MVVVHPSANSDRFDGVWTRLTPPAGIADASASTHPTCDVSHAQPLFDSDQNFRPRAPGAPGADAAAERLEVDLDPDSAEFYDYTTTEWYREPQRTGERHIAGPYVDYICTHEYTFTLSAPVLDGGRFLGVAGADILAARVEQMVGRSLAELPCVAALASGSGRIISSNTTELMPGTILARERLGETMRAVAGPSDHTPRAALPWVLLIGDARVQLR